MFVIVIHFTVTTKLIKFSFGGSLSDSFLSNPTEVYLHCNCAMFIFVHYFVSKTLWEYEQLSNTTSLMMLLTFEHEVGSSMSMRPLLCRLDLVTSPAWLPAPWAHSSITSVPGRSFPPTAELRHHCFDPDHYHHRGVSERSASVTHATIRDCEMLTSYEMTVLWYITQRRRRHGEKPD